MATTTAEKKAKKPKSKNDPVVYGKLTKASKLNRPNSWLLFGLWKRGKTHFAGSISEVPGIINVLHVDIDKGSAPLGDNFPGVHVVRFKKGDLDGFQKFWDKLVANDGEVEGIQMDAVILDTLTILQKWKVKSSRASGWKLWEEINEWVANLLWDLHNMTPVGISCFHVEQHNIMKGREGDEFTMLTPSVQGKESKMSIGAIPDVIAFIDVLEGKKGKVIHTARFQPGPNHNTGGRFNKLPALMDIKGGMKRVYEIIEGE